MTFLLSRVNCFVFLFPSEKPNLDIRVIQISHDGNNNINPPNLMKGEIFERLQTEIDLNLVSCIDIVYTDEYNFEKCKINEKAVRDLTSLSRYENTVIMLTQDDQV